MKKVLVSIGAVLIHQLECKGILVASEFSSLFNNDLKRIDTLRNEEWRNKRKTPWRKRK